MYLVKVSPISNQPIAGELSYFSSKLFDIGDIINVSIRKKKYPAIVIGIKTVEDTKQEIRNSDFKINKIDTLKSIEVFSNEYLKTVYECAKYFKLNIGNFINYTSPGFVIDSDFDFKHEEVREQNLVNEKFALQGKLTDRISFIKKVTRESFARNESVHVIAPTSTGTIFYAEQLSQGIEKSVFVLNSEISKSKQKKIWTEILKSKSPLLIISTPIFFSIPLANIKNIFIENESKSYKQFSAPHISMKDVINVYAKFKMARLYFSDIVLSSETHSKIISKEILPTQTFEKRLKFDTEIKVIDARESKNELSHESRKLIESENSHGFIFSARKGFNPITICGDCGNLVRCSNCETSLSLKTHDGERKFFCRNCLKYYDPKMTCTNCSSWKLYGYGMGVEKYITEVSKFTKNTRIFRIDSDITKTMKEAYEIYSEFEKAPNAILVGTTMALNFIKKAIDYAIIPSFDAFLSIPDYLTEERLLRDILELRDKVKKSMVIETRDPTASILEVVKNGSYTTYIENELKNRSKFNFPPSVVLVRIEKNKKKKNLTYSLSDIAKSVEKFTIEAIEKKSASGDEMLIIKVAHNNWLNKEFSEIIRLISLDYIVEVNPDSVL